MENGKTLGGSTFCPLLLRPHAVPGVSFVDCNSLIFNPARFAGGEQGPAFTNELIANDLRINWQCFHSFTMSRRDILLVVVEKEESFIACRRYASWVITITNKMQYG